MAGPISQFEIKPIIPLKLGGVDISFTNASLFMVIAVVIASLFFTLAMRRHAIIPGPVQSIAEVTYEFIQNVLDENVGKEGRKYFPFIFSIFLFVFLGNALGLLPYSFSYTSHLGAVGGLSAGAIFIMAIIGIRKNGLRYLHTFFPNATPWYLAPILVPIEIISFAAKPFSLTVRLVANMMAGHIMLKIVAGFVAALGILGIVPITFSALIILFETGIAFLQAYVFTILCCIYLNDALHVH